MTTPRRDDDGQNRDSGGGGHDDAIPPGWDYNPSEWSERIPIVVLALVGTAVASYLGAFQLDLVDSVWEPFFGDGTETVLTSETSNVLPIPDGVLGALSYVADAITGIVFGVRRWRTAPWIVVIFGLAVGPLGAVSILLVILQPVLYDSFCTLCLASAVISMAMIGPAMDEILASSQYLKRVHTRGGSVWRAFWGSKDEVRQDLVGAPVGSVA